MKQNNMVKKLIICVEAISYEFELIYPNKLGDKIVHLSGEELMHILTFCIQNIIWLK